MVMSKPRAFTLAFYYPVPEAVQLTGGSVAIGVTQVWFDPGSTLYCVYMI